MKQQRIKVQIVPMYAVGAVWFILFLIDEVLDLALIWVVVLQAMHIVIMVYVAVLSGVKWMAMGIYRLVAVFMIYDVGLLLVFSMCSRGVLVPMLVSLIWLTLIVLDSGRTPFDIAECESELVSGYTTEYGGSMFAFFASMEYGLMLWSVILFTVVVGPIYLGALVCSALLVVFILIRALLPRVFIKDL